MNELKKYIKYPPNILLFLDRKGIIRLDDKRYLRYLYKSNLEKNLNIDNPQTFNEKLQYLKLYDRKDIYTKMVDKYEAKKYAGDIIGNQYIIETLGVWDKFEDIDFEKLPSEFVLKCTHDSGGVIVCSNKKKIEKKEIKKKMEKSLKKNYYYLNREWPYKNVIPRIIAEKYMVPTDQKELIDYKFFCFKGLPEMILVCSERNTNLKKTFFDKDWNFIDLSEGKHGIDKNIPKPLNLELMIELAKKLAKNTKFIRIDFYEIDKKVYFGEFTFFPNAGFEKFNPEKYDKLLGDKIEF